MKRLLITAWLLACSAVAHGQDGPDPPEDDACASATDGMPDGPLTTSFHDGELGQARRPCPRTELALGGTGLLVADFDNFYGNIVASAFARGSLEVVPGTTELFAAVEVFRYQAVLSSIGAEHVGPGHTTLGASHRFYRVRHATVTGHARLVLPTAFLLYDGAWPFGLDIGADALYSPVPRLRFGAHAAIMVSAAATAGAPRPRAGARFTFDASVRIWPAFAVVAQLESGFGWRDGLDLVALGLGLRFAFGDRFGLELGAMFPVAGADRTFVAATLNASWRF